MGHLSGETPAASAPAAERFAFLNALLSQRELRGTVSAHSKLFAHSCAFNFNLRLVHQRRGVYPTFISPCECCVRHVFYMKTFEQSFQSLHASKKCYLCTTTNLVCLKCLSCLYEEIY